MKLHCNPTVTVVSWLKIGGKNFGGPVNFSYFLVELKKFEKKNPRNNEMITSIKFYCNPVVGSWLKVGQRILRFRSIGVVNLFIWWKNPKRYSMNNENNGIFEFLENSKKTSMEKDEKTNVSLFKIMETHLWVRSKESRIL